MTRGRSTARGRRREPSGMDLQAAREARLRRLDVAPAPSTRRQPSASTISGARRSPRSVCTPTVPPSPRAALDLRRLEHRPRPALRPQQPAQLAVVERREGPRQRPARAAPAACGRAASRRSAGSTPSRPRFAQPLGRRRAGRGLALADLVAVDDQHARARPAQLARDGQAGEGRAADRGRRSRRRAGCARRRAWWLGRASDGVGSYEPHAPSDASCNRYSYPPPMKPP